MFGKSVFTSSRYEVTLFVSFETRISKRLHRAVSVSRAIYCPRC